MEGSSVKKVKKDLLQYGRFPQNMEKGKLLKSSFTIRYAKGTNSINYIAIIQGESSKYRVQVNFYNVEYQEEQDITHDMPARVNRKLYWYKKPNFRDNPIKLKSTDPDFRFRFEKELYDKNALIGNWRRYDARKEDKKNGLSAKERKNTEYYKVSHPQGGNYIRKTPQPDKPLLPDWPNGGRPFLNPQGYAGYSYPVNTLLDYLVDKGFVSLK